MHTLLTWTSLCLCLQLTIGLPQISRPTGDFIGTSTPEQDGFDFKINDFEILKDDDGNEYVEVNDMRMTPEQYNCTFGGPTDCPNRLNAIAGDRYRWTNGEVPYEYKAGQTFTSKQKEAVKLAVDNFNQMMQGCVTIRPARSSDGNRVVIQNTNSGSCWSYVGSISRSKQSMNLGGWCFTPWTIVHEFIHAIGHYHEQNRKDRNDYVTIASQHKNNHNYARQQNALLFGLPYDYFSIMHYKGGMTVKDSNHVATGVTLGGGREMTYWDRRKLEKLYNCPVAKESTCPKSHSYAFKNGQKCCKSNRQCGNTHFIRNSECCSGNDYVDCPAGTNCYDYREESCPISHPYAYYNGYYCCKQRKEKNYAAQGSKCDGGVLGQDSLCCKGDDYKYCGGHKCTDYYQATKKARTSPPTSEDGTKKLSQGSFRFGGIEDKEEASTQQPNIQG